MGRRAVVIGLDGAAWKLLDPILREGAMPRLRSLVTEGARGDLRSTIPPVTPTAWTSSVTGVNPGRHGVYGFLTGNIQSERQEFVHSGRLRSAPLWEIANAQGATVGVFNLPLTYPPRPLDGWMVSGMMTPGEGERLSGFVSPNELEAKVLGWQPDYVIEIEANQEKDWKDDSLAYRALEALRHRKVVLERLLDEHPVDIVFTVFETPDRLQHLYYGYMDENDPLYDTYAARRIRPAILENFALMDEIAGMLIEYAGSEGGVIVCSDHGFTGWDMSVHTNNLLRDWGLLSLRSGAGLMQSKVAPKLASVARRVVPKKVRGEARKRTLAAIDWSRTQAFASIYYQEGVFLNLRGRERFGTVAPEEAAVLMKTIAERFAELRGPDGELVTDNVYFAEDVYEGTATEDAPDIMLELRDHRYVVDDEIFHPTAFTDHRQLPRGAHHPDGIMVVAGRDVRPTELQGASIVDVTPTLLHLAGLEVPRELDGRVLEDALERGVEAVRYTDPFVRADATTESPYSAEEEAEIEEALKGLGYL